MQLSEPLAAFLRTRLASIDQIEIVLLLRMEPERAWTAPEVSAALSMAPESTAMRLFLLASAGLIAFEPSSVPRYRYAAGDAEVESLLSELNEAYATDRVAVMQAIGAPPDPVRSFADAFKLKK